ncbi:MBL fold metallo-hydrolase [Halorarius halobius]|uniref:MBL fold metallo-hydrolase n=1 Tax=Halorarius halobius TaxID=2962671 RepID=UPI0020CC941E|nr:MBL fold metallo-hydrolase [Halorarius halobius]
MVKHDGLTVEWLGYATLRVAGDGVTVYCDPGRYGVLDGREPRDGDVVCVTHDHHYDPDGIRRVAAPDATVVIFDGVNTHRIDRDVDRPADLDFTVREVDDEADIAVGEVIVRTVPAYNDPDGPHTGADGEPYHPEGLGCGYHLTVPSEWGRNVRVFWPGDTDVLAGHERLDVSLFCPPIGGSFTMDRHEAADLAVAIDPDLVLPIHYDTFDALETDAGAFAADVASRGVPVVLDE